MKIPCFKKCLTTLIFFCQVKGRHQLQQHYQMAPSITHIEVPFLPIPSSYSPKPKGHKHQTDSL